MKRINLIVFGFIFFLLFGICDVNAKTLSFIDINGKNYDITLEDNTTDDKMLEEVSKLINVSKDNVIIMDAYFIRNNFSELKEGIRYILLDKSKDRIFMHRGTDFNNTDLGTSGLNVTTTTSSEQFINFYLNKVKDVFGLTDEKVNTKREKNFWNINYSINNYQSENSKIDNNIPFTYDLESSYLQLLIGFHETNGTNDNSSTVFIPGDLQFIVEIPKELQGNYQYKIAFYDQSDDQSEYEQCINESWHTDIDKCKISYDIKKVIDPQVKDGNLEFTYPIESYSFFKILAISNSIEEIPTDGSSFVNNVDNINDENINNPDTYDNILLYIGLGILSIIGTGILGISYNRK